MTAEESGAFNADDSERSSQFSTRDLGVNGRDGVAGIARFEFGALTGSRSGEVESGQETNEAT